MRTIVLIAALSMIGWSNSADAACGDRGGPGVRLGSGKCASWADIGQSSPRRSSGSGSWGKIVDVAGLDRSVLPQGAPISKVYGAIAYSKNDYFAWSDIELSPEKALAVALKRCSTYGPGCNASEVVHGECISLTRGQSGYWLNKERWQGVRECWAKSTDCNVVVEICPGF